MLHILIETLRNSILISGLVVVMMMMIESLNIESQGMFFKGLRKTKTGQVVIAALLGSIPGCMGGFATVSLYTHRMSSFGALVAMMIASSGDEAFMMMAMIPKQALILFAILFVLAIAVGICVDHIWNRKHSRTCTKHEHSECGPATDCHDGYAIHETEKSKRHFSIHRILMLLGLAAFIGALATGKLGHDHSAHSHDAHEHAVHEHAVHEHVHTDACTHEHHHDSEIEHTFKINLLSEDWMNVLFAGLSIIMLIVLIFASDHFVEGHLWDHIVKRHLPTIFAWTFGVLLVLGLILQRLDIADWISDNTVLMILLASLIGIIPESGPHMIFVTLFAAGVVPFPVLLASSISQDGHASIPLLAESRRSFVYAKAINVIIAVAAGLAAMLFI
jgi:hypothetical protein